MKALFCMICLIGVIFAQYGDATLDIILSVYDGDTFRGDIKGYPPIIGRSISIRIYGIDAPEIRSKKPSEKLKARAAKKLLTSLLSNRRVTLVDMQRDKYFRILAKVYADSIDVADSLVRANLARPYFGGSKISW